MKNGNNIHIRIAKDFSDTPGPRDRDEGKHSGAEFLDSLLAPKFKLALESNSKLFIDLDGTEGYATSFLESSFGGLARMYDPQQVLKHIEIVSTEEPYLTDEIKKYIREANNK